MKKLKFIYLVLLSFGLIFFTYSTEVNALEGWVYHEESPFSVPSTEDFGAVFWSDGGFYGVEGYWDFVVPFQLEVYSTLSTINVVVIEDLAFYLWLDNYDGSPGYDNYKRMNVYDYYDEMTVECDMILYGDADTYVIDVSDNVYELMTSGYVFDRVDVFYSTDDIISRIEFVFEIDYHIDLTGLDFDQIDYNYMIHQYEIELYYNPSVYYYGYSQGLQDGYDDGYQDGYDDGLEDGYAGGLLESDVEEAYQQGFKDGEKSKLAENNAAFYDGIGKWLVPVVITVIVLGGIVSIASIKRREQ